MIVREATPADLDAVVVLWLEMMVFHEAVNAYFTMSEDAEEAYKIYAAGNIADDDNLVLVCVDKGDVIGFIYAEIRDYPPVYPVEKYAQISEIAVTEKKRRRGAGELLLCGALEWALQQGVSRALCAVAVDNHVSQSFWTKNGFQRVTEIRVREL